MRASISSKLCFAGILAAFALAGCGSGHSSSGGSGYATFSWYLFDIEDTQYTTALTCAEVGAATVVVTLTGQAGTYQATANCVDGVVTTGTVPGGSYTAGFDLYGDPAIYGNTTTLLDSFDATGTFHVLAGANDFQANYAPFIAQSFTLGWNVTYQGALATCAYVGASYVDLDFALTGSTTWVTNRFNCSTGIGVSYAIPLPSSSTVNTVQWKLYLVDASGTGDLLTIPGGTLTLPTTTNVNLPVQYFSF